MTSLSSENGTDSIRITSYALSTCVGVGRANHLDAMLAGRSGLTPSDYPDLPFDCYIGRVPGLDSMDFPADRRV